MNALLSPVALAGTALACATSLLAQVPTDTVLVLRNTPNNALNFAIADVFGRGTTEVENQNVLLTPPPNSVASDPSSGDFFFLSPSLFAGAWRVTLGPLARFQSSVWGAWQQQAGERVEVGALRVLTLRSGNVESRPKSAGSPGPAQLLFTLAGAVDLAVAEPLVYAATGNGPLVEFDLNTSTTRTVGSYGGVRCVARSPVAPELCLGLVSGDLERIDVVTGASLGTVPTGLGALVAVAYTRFGTLVCADSQSVWSELSPSAPIFTSSTTIFDLDVARFQVASSSPYGSACGAVTGSSWNVVGAPAVGSAGYTVGLRDGVPASFAVLALGDNRAASSLLGAPLPIDLSALGAPGCLLLVDPLVLLAQPSNVFGEADQPLPIPAAPILSGVEWSAQWVQPDPLIGPFGLVTTRGLAIAIL